MRCLARCASRLSVLVVVMLVACDSGSDPGSSENAINDSPVMFRDVAKLAGLHFTHATGATGRKYLPECMGAGGCVIDIDGDGLMDVYLVQSGKLQDAQGPDPHLGNKLFRNLGDGTFEDVTEKSGTGDESYGMGAVAADFDGDGDSDIYVLNYGPNVLYQNDGKGKFANVADRAKVGGPSASWSCSGTFFDADGDGDLDLYVVNYVLFTVATHRECGDTARAQPAYCSPDVYPVDPDRFYRNRGDGTFEDATAAANLTDTTGKGLGVVAADLDDDGDQDLYVANDATPNFLYTNRGDGTFDEDGIILGVSHNEDGKTEAGMGVDAGDLDGDGKLDIFVTNLAGETNSLYLGGKQDYEYATRRCGLHAASYNLVGFGTDFLDVDNDGDMDIYVTNGHIIDNISYFSDSETWAQGDQVFLNDGSGKLRELPGSELGDPALKRVGRGTMTIDFDNDGRLDVLTTNNSQGPCLYRNVLKHTGNWIGFLLKGPDLNTGAVGARVTVTVGDRSLIDERKTGSSYTTSGDPRMHFGLGGATTADRVTIRWPGGSSQTIEKLAAGSYYRIRAGKQPVSLTYPR